MVSEYIDLAVWAASAFGRLVDLIDGLPVTIVCALAMAIGFGVLMFKNIRTRMTTSVGGRTICPGLGDAAIAVAVLTVMVLRPHSAITGGDLLIGGVVTTSCIALLAMWSICASSGYRGRHGETRLS